MTFVKVVNLSKRMNSKKCFLNNKDDFWCYVNSQNTAISLKAIHYFLMNKANFVPAS